MEFTVFVRLLNTELVSRPPLTPRIVMNDNTEQASLIFILHLCDLTAIPPIKSLMRAVSEVMRHLLRLSDSVFQNSLTLTGDLDFGGFLWGNFL